MHTFFIVIKLLLWHTIFRILFYIFENTLIQTFLFSPTASFNKFTCYKCNFYFFISALNLSLFQDRRFKDHWLSTCWLILILLISILLFFYLFISAMKCSLLQAAIKIQTLIRMFLAMVHKEKLFIRYCSRIFFSFFLED